VVLRVTLTFVQQALLS